MKTIKVKPEHPGPRIIEKVLRTPQNAKAGYSHVKEQTEQTQTSDSNPGNYATDKISTAAQKTAHSAIANGQKLTHKVRGAVRGNRNAGRLFKDAADATKKGAKTAGRTVKASGKTAKAAGKGIKTSAQAAKTTAKASKIAADVARRAAVAAAKAMKAAIQLMVKLIQLTIKAVIAAIKATIAAVKGLIAAIAAGGWVVLLVIIVIGATAFLILSPFGILTGGGAENTPTISEMIQTLNSELTDKIAQIQKQAGHVDKVIVSFNGNEDNSFIDNWPDILAVFAVETSMSIQNPMDVVVMDEKRISQIRKVFWDMNTISSEITDATPVTTSTDSSSPESTATPAPSRTLTIHVNSKYWDDMISAYNFNTDQVNMLKELMSAKNVTLLMQLVDSVTGKPATDWSSIIDVPEGGMNIPLYMQGDYPQTVCYIDGVAKSVKTSGCGATSDSMVIAYLTGNTDQTPYTLFKWAYDNGYYTGNGLGHSCLTKLASLYGVKGTWIENSASQITAALQAGHPVIAHMGPGIFTTSGHYIVLRGVTEDGYVLVNDPGSRNKNKYAYKLSTVVSQARTANAFMVCENSN